MEEEARRARLNSGYVLEGPGEEGMALEGWGPPGEAETQQGAQLQGERPRALNLEEESSEHLRWTHLEQV